MRRGGTIVLAVALAAAIGGASASLAGHDKTPPKTFIDGGPGARTADRTPTFSFSSNERKARFVCKRDSGGFSPCGSPKTLKQLPYGRHGFYVRAIDPFDNRDATAAAYVFKVVKP